MKGKDVLVLDFKFKALRKGLVEVQWSCNLSKEEFEILSKAVGDIYKLRRAAEEK